MVGSVISNWRVKNSDGVTEIAERMECGESAPLCFLETQSGADSPHSIRWRAPGKRLKPKKIGVNPLYPRHQRSMNPYIQLIAALVMIMELNKEIERGANSEDKGELF